MQSIRLAATGTLRPAGVLAMAVLTQAMPAASPATTYAGGSSTPVAALPPPGALSAAAVRGRFAISSLVEGGTVRDEGEARRGEMADEDGGLVASRLVRGEAPWKVSR